MANVSHPTRAAASQRCLCLITVAIALQGCAGDADDGSPEPSPAPCQSSQPWPYPPGIPYAGIHAGPRNDDYVDCDTATAFSLTWHALHGKGLIQPNTFSPDGATVYATTTSAEAEGCRLHALDAATGALRWCRPGHPSLAAGSVLVDEDGHLYVAEEATILSLTPSGDVRWRATVPYEGQTGLLSGLIGLHFSRGGHVLTVDGRGVIHAVSRAEGRVVGSLSIPDAFGFEDLSEVGTSIPLLNLFPQAIRDDFVRTMGSAAEANLFLSGFLGFGGEFSDNTITVGPDGSLYVVGGGPTPSNGALVQVRTSETPEAVVMTPGWYVATVGGSAATPSISGDGQFIVISDGAAADNFLNPLPAHAILIDVRACDRNEDGDPAPSICDPIYLLPLERGAMAGSPAILSGGEVIFWELGSDLGESEPGSRDVAGFGPEGLRWELSLPEGFDWTSIITVSRTHFWGTMSRITPSSRSVLRFRIPQAVEHALVVVDRSTREVVFTHPIPDDSAATVTIGPDGALYVGMLGLVSHFALDQRPTLGLLRFSPQSGP